MWSFVVCSPNQISLGWSHQGRWDVACGMHGGQEKCVHGFGGEIWRKVATLEHLVIIIVIIDLREIGWDSVAWVHVAQNRDSWQSVVSLIINLGFLLNTENLSTKWRAFQEWPYLINLEFTVYIELSYEYTSSKQLWQISHLIIVVGSIKLSSSLVQVYRDYECSE
jgi:hypothetical protein